jgi:acetyl esterase/lipase
MKTLKNIIFSSLFLTLFLACSNESADIESPVEPEVIEAYQAINVSYGSDANQVFDIYLPENRTESTKTLILVHGGSWVAGDKADMNAVKVFISALHPNVGIINMNYRLAGINNSPFPMQIDDISAVVEYLSDNTSLLTVSDDIGFIGVSAGAHLAMLWSYAHDTNSQVDMVCSIVGPANFTDPAYYESTNPSYQAIYQLFGNPSVEFLESVSPFHTATASSPPTQLFYGGMDPLVPSSQGIDMDARLTELDVTHQFQFYPEEGHGWEGPNQTDTLTKISTYIETYIEAE